MPGDGSPGDGPARRYSCRNPRRIFNQATTCGDKAFTNGTELLAEAQVLGNQIKTAAG